MAEKLVGKKWPDETTRLVDCKVVYPTAHQTDFIIEHTDLHLTTLASHPTGVPVHAFCFELAP